MKRRLIEFLVLLLVALGSAPLSAQVWKWSQTAATNATADPNINWSEGQSPSSVNDSARAMMGQLARWRDDISGALVTTGSSTAYVLTTNEGLQTPTPVNGQMIAISVHVTNSGGATLAADGGTAYSIQASPGIEVPAGTLIAGSPYTLKFSLADSSWLLRDLYGNPYSVPLGGMIPYTGDTAPNSNFALPYGQCISRTTYASYFALVSTRFGSCDGTTTFGLPDMRGRTIAGIDCLGGGCASRLTAAYFGTNANITGAVGGGENWILSQSQLPATTLSFTGNTVNWTGTANNSNIPVNAGTQGISVSAGGVAVYTPGAVAATLNVTTQVTPSGSISSFGSGSPHRTIQPTMVMSYILRVL